MRIVLSTISEFHIYHVARELHRRGVLAQLFTGQPRWRLRSKSLPTDFVTTYPYLQTIFEGMGRLGFQRYPLKAELNRVCHQSLDRFVARHIPDCEIFDALSYNGLHSGRTAQRQGARWVCRCANSHMGFQDAILREEYARVGLPYTGEDPYLLAYAEASYAGADLILTQSSFARQSFVDRGTLPEKVVALPTSPRRVLPSGQATQTKPHDEFRVLYIGQLTVRKGVHDLVQAFRLAAIPNSRLQLIGTITPETQRLLGKPGSSVELFGVRPKSELASYYEQADAFVLASIEEGMPGALCEALAYGRPIVATENTGARNLFSDGVEGFIVPIRSPEAIAEKLVWLYEHPAERRAMGDAARARADRQGGWEQYGERLLALYRQLGEQEDQRVISVESRR